MNRLLPGTLLLAALLGAGGAMAAPRTVTSPNAPRALDVQGPVQVSWGDPAQFTEIRRSTNRFEAVRGDWVRELARYVRSAAGKRLPDGQQLDVTFVDIKRAGEFEPWHGPQSQGIRIMRDIYPPRITLQYTLKDAGGAVLDQGEAKLSDSGYLQNIGLQSSNDPLRYEKKLLDDWIRRSLLPNKATAGR